MCGLRLWCRERASLIMHQRGKSIRDHVHSLHEADIYALKNTCPLTLNPWTGKVGLSSPGCSSPGPGRGGGPHPTLRHHVCPVPDKTLKHAWDAYSTMANSTYLTPHPPLRTRLHVCCHTCQSFCEEKKQKKQVWSHYRRCWWTKNWHFLPFCCVSDLCKYYRLNL